MPETSKTSDTLKSAWESLLKKNTKTTGYSSVRVFAKSKRSIFVGQHQPSALIDFAFEVSAKSLKRISLRQQAKGFDVSVQNQSKSGKIGTCRVSITLNRASFADLFKVLAADILEHCLAATREAEAMSELNARLQHWRRFSEKFGNEGLTEPEQTGLFGELFFLRSLISLGLNEVRVLESWSGPDRDNQDFCFGPLAVEIKATTSNNSDQVSISNLRQLDDAGLDDLYLFHVSFDKRDGSGETLPTVIANLMARFKAISSECEDLFENLLMTQGYHHAQNSLYELAGYTLRKQQIYEVASGFPRILESDLAAGIVEAKYEIDLASAESFKRNFEEVVSQNLLV